jgi:hypothetical protein
VTTQAEMERMAGDRFIAWYNLSHGTNFAFAMRPGDAPDLEYRDGRNTLRVEVTEAFYDDLSDPRFKWQHLRGDSNAPRAWAAVEPDGALAVRIQARLQQKAVKAYGPGCILLIHVDPTASNPEDVERILRDINIPAKHGFEGVYVAGFFGFSGRNEAPGYRCWGLYEA